jgi:D-alanyl-D-alanine carboxypeptidase
MRSYFVLLTLLAACFFGGLLHAQITLAQQEQVAQIAADTLAKTGAPSASIAIVENGRVVYAHAFGLAHVQPDVMAQAAMAYPIGSISKQFTASAVMMLQQDGKLSVDDPVSKYFPQLTRAGEVRLRNLLTMTSGYEDYAPEDYTIPAWLDPTAPLAIVNEWAKKPLDFAPGSDRQYSNTNYVLLALIVEKVSGEPFAQFIRERVLAPAHVDNAFNAYTDRHKLQVTGYVSDALQPVREQPLEANGWYFGDGDLAMPAASLAQWDICMMSRCLLTARSYAEQETPFHFTAGPKSGQDSGYGFGIYVSESNGLVKFEHSGEVGGFVAENVVYPQQQAAIVVLTNEVASSAAGMIAAELAPMVLGPAMPKPPAQVKDSFVPQLRQILTGLAQGRIDRALFTANCNAYFDTAAIQDYEHELAPLGALTELERTRTSRRGGMDFAEYRATFRQGTVLKLTVYLRPDGKIEQLLVVGKG